MPSNLAARRCYLCRLSLQYHEANGAVGVCISGMRQQEIALRRYEGPPRLSADPRAHIQSVPKFLTI